MLSATREGRTYKPTPATTDRSVPRSRRHGVCDREGRTVRTEEKRAQLGKEGGDSRGMNRQVKGKGWQYDRCS